MDKLDTRQFEHEGATFVADIVYDDTAEMPWDREEGHAPVRYAQVPYGSRRPHKEPGERILHTDGRDCWLYDWQGGCRLARRDGWRASADDPSIEHAVQADFDRLRGFLRGDWHYVGIVVSLKSAPERFTASLYGIESDATEYIDETMRELAGEIYHEMCYA